MSFKEFSLAHNAPSKNKPADTSKDTPKADQPAAKDDKTADEIGPAPKA